MWCEALFILVTFSAPLCNADDPEIDIPESSGQGVMYKIHEVKYYLYTRNNPDAPQQLLFGGDSLLDNSLYDHGKVLVFFCHDYWETGFGYSSMLLKEAFLEDGDVNFIVADWSPRSLADYVTSRSAIPTIGREIGSFINWLASKGTSYQKVHCVGFSVGAHAMGIAGRTTGSQIGRLTGLDPAGRLWEVDTDHISNTDACYVEIIHTNVHGYGTRKPCGDADFYVNGGDSQPGCMVVSCSHMRSCEYFASTVKNKNNNMLSKACDSLLDAITIGSICDGNEYVMGTSDLTKSGSGLFRVSTLGVYPFFSE